jgi:hypothetical protein
MLAQVTSVLYTALSCCIRIAGFNMRKLIFVPGRDHMIYYAPAQVTSHKQQSTATHNSNTQQQQQQRATWVRDWGARWAQDERGMGARLERD